jgi:transcriptional regulator GlxA family with amidase domain
MDKRRLAILVFDDVEVLDFAGPYEVFSRTRLRPGIESRRSDEHAPFEVFTIAASDGPVTAIGGLHILPDHTFATSPPIDILVVPGGFGTRRLLEDAPVLAWIQETASAASLTTSVCTGSLLLAKAGLLRNRRATTHWGALDILASLDPTIHVEPDRVFVDDTVITSAGVSAGIEMSLHVVEKLHGAAVADETAHYIEYPRTAALGARRRP